MPEGLGEAADAFRDALNSTEMVPVNRGSDGRFRESGPRPEQLFQERRTEGDELTGDTRDGGEDARLRRQEERANGEPFDSQQRQLRGRDLHAPANQEHQRTQNVEDRTENERSGEGTDIEGVDLDADAALLRGHSEGLSGDDTSGEGGEGSEERYEITVDGKPQEVTLREALDGYIRTETFHQRMNQVNQERNGVAAEANRVAQMRDNYINQAAILEQEIITLLPKEPDWDAEYARDPKAAYALRKQYDAVAGKLNQLRQGRAAAVQEQQQEFARNTEIYAKNEFAQFVMEEKIQDEATLKKEIASMRRTAMAAGFTEPEVATVYDKRMLKVLRKASKYDRLVAARAKGVPPGKGKALTPGSAPRIGNAGRRSIDEAQRRLANSGRIDDAASVFEKLLR